MKPAIDDESHDALEAAESRLSAVLAAVRHHVLELSPEGVILDVNRTYEGLTVEQTIGSHVLNWLPPNDRPRFQAAMDAVLAGEARVEIAIQASAADGGDVPYLLSLTPIRSKGAIVGVMAVAEDVSAFQRAQVERERQRRLADVGRVTASIAHDYNTLFTAMLCSLDSARLVGDDPTLLREELGTLETAISGAAQLTRHLTRASRTSAPSADGCDLRAELLELAPLLERVAGHDVELDLQLCEGPLHSRLQGPDLSQLMLNLVSNAREAMPAGGRIVVSLEVEDGTVDGERRALLRVADTGPGIEEHVVEHIFEPYFSTKERGSGFGLATCYGITVAAGGDIQVRRASTGGALIEVRLPTQTPTSAAPEHAPALPRAQASARATLLIVEDNPEVRAALRRHLTRVGFNVLVGCNGIDALEVLRRHPSPVDLVITDIMMRGGSGIDLLRTLQNERPAVRTFAITGHALDTDLDWLQEHRVPVLHKPFSAHDLELRVRALLA